MRTRAFAENYEKVFSIVGLYQNDEIFKLTSTRVRVLLTYICANQYVKINETCLNCCGYGTLFIFLNEQQCLFCTLLCSD